jgi:DNA-binding transcriptional LysR family regulator
MTAFVRAVEEGSFTKAADKLEITAQMVGKHVRALEQWTGTRLMNKTTRQQSLTETGNLFYQRCKTILGEIAATKAIVEEMQAEPRGRLKLAAPLSFGQCLLVPMLPSFLQAHPHIEMDLYLSNRFVDLVEEGFDAVIRVQSPGDEQFVAKPLGEQQLCLCAAPSYLEKYGKPVHPVELKHHQCLHGNWGGNETWSFQGPDGTHHIKISSRLKINNWPALFSAALHGGGISLQPIHMLQQALAQHELVPLLEDYTIPAIRLYLFFPPARQQTLKLRCFADALQKYLQTRTIHAAPAP